MASLKLATARRGACVDWSADWVSDLVEQRLRTVEKLLSGIRRGKVVEPGVVHRLRVATRRARTSLEVAEAAGAPESAAERKALHRLRRIRREASEARVIEVLERALTQRLEELLTGSERTAIAFMLGVLSQEEKAANAKVVRVAERYGAGKFRRMRRSLVRGLRGAGAAVGPDQASTALAAQLASDVQAEANENLADPDRLHAFRLAIKRLRYCLEAMKGESSTRFENLMLQVMGLQEDLGRLNDLNEAAHRVAALRDRAASSRASRPGAMPEEIPEGLDVLASKLDAEHRERLEEFLREWAESGAERLKRAIGEALGEAPGGAADWAETSEAPLVMVRSLQEAPAGERVSV